MKNPFLTLEQKIDAVANQLAIMVTANLKENRKADIEILQEKYLRPERAAELLDTSRQTLWKYSKLGILPVYRFGTETRFKLSELLAFPQLIKK